MHKTRTTQETRLSNKHNNTTYKERNNIIIKTTKHTQTYNNTHKTQQQKLQNNKHNKTQIKHKHIQIATTICKHKKQQHTQPTTNGTHSTKKHK